MNQSETQAKMLQARDLIKAKRYAEARKILQIVDHPKAREWLAKLDEIDLGDPFAHERPPIAPFPKKRGRLDRRVALLLFVVLIVIAGVAIWYYNASIAPANRALNDAVKDLDYQYNFCGTYCSAINGDSTCLDTCLKTPAALHRATPTP